ncbi:MAG: 7-carboxy-7-deazaguanine synthase QueE [Candidatus Methylacidiphilales bacterium]
MVVSESDLARTLTVNEIYGSVQGESTFAGERCAFVRLTFCDLRCTYCDTTYAFYEGSKRTIGSIVEEVEALGIPLVEVTGGEPLLQPNAAVLTRVLCDRGYTVLVETAGAHDISVLDARVIRIMDLKCPDSGMADRNLWSNIDHLTVRDEVKFVIGSRGDYEWARDQVGRWRLADRVRAVLFSPVFGRIEPKVLVEWILADRLPVRFQLQMHKFIWPPSERGV